MKPGYCDDGIFPFKQCILTQYTLPAVLVLFDNLKMVFLELWWGSVGNDRATIASLSRELIHFKERWVYCLTVEVIFKNHTNEKKFFFVLNTQDSTFKKSIFSLQNLCFLLNSLFSDMDEMPKYMQQGVITDT